MEESNLPTVKWSLINIKLLTNIKCCSVATLLCVCESKRKGYDLLVALQVYYQENTLATPLNRFIYLIILNLKVEENSLLRNWGA